jgi:hypothetical protein
MRSRLSYRILLKLIHYTGMGHVGVKLAKIQELRPDRGLEVLQVSEFGRWADDLCRECARDFSFAAVRDAVTLNTLFPPSEARYLRLVFVRDGRPVGWVLALATQMQDHKQFGNMRVGSIIDCLALPNEIPAVSSAASGFLENAGVNLIVTNQSNRSWCDALRRCGFRRGPSNVALGLSPKLAKTLGAEADNLDAFHINRGDGDIPVKL